MGLHLFYSQDNNAHVWNAVLEIMNWTSVIPVWESSDIPARLQDKFLLMKRFEIQKYIWNTEEQKKKVEYGSSATDFQTIYLFFSEIKNTERIMWICNLFLLS